MALRYPKHQSLASERAWSEWSESITSGGVLVIALTFRERAATLIVAHHAIANET